MKNKQENEQLNEQTIKVHMVEKNKQCKLGT